VTIAIAPRPRDLLPGFLCRDRAALARCRHPREQALFAAAHPAGADRSSNRRDLLGRVLALREPLLDNPGALVFNSLSFAAVAVRHR
jgi:hypothetical protein